MEPVSEDEEEKTGSTEQGYSKAANEGELEGMAVASEVHWSPQTSLEDLSLKITQKND